jgi:transcriptional regulator with XRE-family HTH domain
MQRAILGMSQTRLGEALGITFQQVQKYEKGINRVGASRLSRIAEVLGVSVSYFFEDSRPVGADAPPAGKDHDLMSFLSTPEGFELNRAFARIADARLRRQLASLVTAIATTDNLKARVVGR